MDLLLNLGRGAFAGLALSTMLLAGCGPSIVVGPEGGGTLNLEGAIDAPYLLLDRADWLDFDQSAAAASIAAAIQGGNRRLVKLHDGSVIDAANKAANMKGENVLQLRHAAYDIPVSKVEITTENATVRQDVVFDSSIEGSFGITGFVASGAHAKRLYAFKANLKKHTATYEFSITELVQSGLLLRGRLDLRGLPRVYYTFDELENKTGYGVSAEATVSGGFTILTAGSKGLIKYDQGSVASFHNKVFAVDFFHDPSYDSSLTYKQTASALESDHIAFADLPLEDSPTFKEWAAGSSPTKDTWYTISDALSQKSYKVTVWIKPSGTPQSQSDERWLTVKTDSYHDVKSTLEIKDGVPRELLPDKATLVRQLDVPEGEMNPYNAQWVYFAPGKSVDFVTVDKNWRMRTSFVRFVK